MTVTWPMVLLQLLRLNSVMVYNSHSGNHAYIRPQCINGHSVAKTRMRTVIMVAFLKWR